MVAIRHDDRACAPPIRRIHQLSDLLRLVLEPLAGRGTRIDDGNDPTRDHHVPEANVQEFGRQAPNLPPPGTNSKHPQKLTRYFAPAPAVAPGPPSSQPPPVR